MGKAVLETPPTVQAATTGPPTDVIPMAENMQATEGHKVESILNELGHGGSLDRKRDCPIKTCQLYMYQDCCAVFCFLGPVNRDGYIRAKSCKENSKVPFRRFLLLG